jgi:serine/threonine-protein phosphatase PGAM5
MKKKSFREGSTIKLLVLFIILIAVFPLNSQEKNENGSRTIYLIRHGQYDLSDERDPDVGRGLVPLGIAQTKLVTDRLKGLPVNMTSLISSTMTRARQTAMIINQEFPELILQRDSLIRECTMPTWREDIMEEEDPEDLVDCTAKLDSAFSIYFKSSPDENDRHDIIVCHGNVIRYFVTKALNVNSLSWLQMTVTNCGITVIKIKPDGMMKLISFNDRGHIPANMQTSTGGDNKPKALELPDE